MAFMKLRSFIIPFLLLISLIPGKNILDKGKGTEMQMPQPVEGEENEKLRELYNALRHKAAPGVVWQQVEMQNALQTRTLLKRRGPSSSFANGAINGTW